MKAAIFATGCYQREIAKDAGISEACLSMVLHGKYNLSWQEEIALAGVLNVERREIFD